MSSEQVPIFARSDHTLHVDTMSISLLLLLAICAAASVPRHSRSLQRVARDYSNPSPPLPPILTTPSVLEQAQDFLSAPAPSCPAFVQAPHVPPPQMLYN